MAEPSEIVVSLSDEQIWRAGTPVPMRRQVFRLLRFFLDNPNEILTNERILEGVWPDTHVSDASVKATVKLLRQVLDDDAVSPRFIETVRGRGYRYLGGLSVGDGKASDSESRPGNVAEPPSIAVLPFDNLSGDREQDYFSDGICDDIITDLSKIAGLMVIARNSSFRYRGRNVDIRKAGRELGVKAILEGSIRRVGDRIRINAQLLDAETGMHIWAERFETDITDVFAVQDEVTRSVVGALEVRLTSAEENRLTAGAAPTNIKAHDLFLRGRELLLGPRKDADTFARSVELLEGAIAVDPEYGKPYATLALAYVLDFQNSWSDGTGDALNKAKELAESAITKAPGDPSSHHIAAVVAGYMRDYDYGEREILTALELGPNHAFSVNARGLGLMYTGRSGEAIPFIERALRLDPAMREMYLHFLGMANLIAGNYEEAVIHLRERVFLNSTTDVSRAYLASALGQIGKVDEAQAVWRDLKEVNPEFSLDERLAKLPFQRQSDRDTIRAGLAMAGVRD